MPFQTRRHKRSSEKIAHVTAGMIYKTIGGHVVGGAVHNVMRIVDGAAFASSALLMGIALCNAAFHADWDQTGVLLNDVAASGGSITSVLLAGNSPFDVARPPAGLRALALLMASGVRMAADSPALLADNAFNLLGLSEGAPTLVESLISALSACTVAARLVVLAAAAAYMLEGALVGRVAGPARAAARRRLSLGVVVYGPLLFPLLWAALEGDELDTIAMVSQYALGCAFAAAGWPPLAHRTAVMAGSAAAISGGAMALSQADTGLVTFAGIVFLSSVSVLGAALTIVVPQTAPAGALFRLGNVLCVLSVFFAAVAVTNDWFDATFEPYDINLDVIGNLTFASDTMDDIISRLGDVAQSLDPCSYQETIRLDSSADFVGVTDQTSLQENLRQAREAAAASDSDLSQCVGEAPNFDFVHGVGAGPPQCIEFREQYTDTASDTSSGISDARSDFDALVHGDITTETYVDRACVQAQCQRLTAVTAAALVTSFIPFLSVVSRALTMAVRAAFIVYKIGRRVTRLLPSLRRRVAPLKSLVKRIARLAIVTARRTSPARSSLLMLTPVLTAAAVGLTIVFFQRDSVRRVGLLGVYVPLALSNAVFAGLSYILPSALSRTLAALPAEFVTGTVVEMPGLAALRVCFVMSALGSALCALTALSSAPRRPGGVATRSQITRAAPAGAAAGPNVALAALPFAAAVFYISISSILAHREYLHVSYGPNDDTTSARVELSESIIAQTQTDSLFMEFDDSICGVEAEAVNNILSGALSLLSIKDLVLGVKEALDEGLGAAATFVDDFTDLVDVPTVDIDFDILPRHALHAALHAVPLASATVFVALPLAPRSLAPPLAGAVAYVNLAVTILHALVISILVGVLSADMPFITVRATPGDAFYDAQLSAFLVLLASVGIYVNHAI